MITYQEAEAFLFDQLPMFQRVGGAAYKKDLHNTFKLLEYLGNPHLKRKYVHVAGTNGKGSTSSFLASILTEAGYKTGLYTSPHLKSFTERMRIDGRAIAEERVVKYVEKFKPIIAELRPSFFELTTAMAFDYFNEEEVDIAVIEVGMGGRLDCTNVISPQVSVITQIGLDHQQFLGNTLEEITKEKAGIIKEKTPVVTSVIESELRLIIEKIANQKNAQFTDCNSRFKVSVVNSTQPNWEIEVQDQKEMTMIRLNLGMSATYQLQNLKSVLGAIKELKEQGFLISDDAIKLGFENVIKNSGIKGRWQVLSSAKGRAKLIADTGHNATAFEYIINMLGNEKFEKLHFVLAAVNDKKIDDVLSMLPKQAIYYFTQANIPRALKADDLKSVAAQYALSGDVYNSVSEAVGAAEKNATEKDLIFVGGSTFAVAEIPGL